MPNWISGSLKIRGPYENVKRFFLENLNVYKTVWDKNNGESYTQTVPKEEWLLKSEEYGEPGAREFYMNIKPGKWIYVEGTRRAFISSEYISFYENPRQKDALVIAACEINQAWGFDTEDWLELSKKYQVDLRLWGLEKGMEYGSEIIIENGVVIKDEDWKYNDWDWEAPLPWLGG